MAHRKRGREGLRLVIHHGLDSKTACDFGGGSDPIVAYFVRSVGDAAEIEVGAAPKAVAFGLQGLVHQRARHGGARTVQTSHQQQAVGRIQAGGDRTSVKIVGARTGQRSAGVEDGQGAEFGVHRGAIAAQGFADLRGRSLHQRRVFGDAQRHAEAENSVADGGGDGLNVFLGGNGRRRWIDKELVLLEKIQQWLLELLAIFRARHGLAGRQIQAEDLVSGDVALFGVMLRYAFGFRQTRIVNKDNGCPRIRAAERGDGGEESERCGQKGSAQHPASG